MTRVLSLAGILLLGACTSIGSRALPSNQLAYNDAVSNAEARELLLNVVRLRYADPIKFLSVNSVTTSFSVGVGAGAELGVDGGDPQRLFLPNVRYADTPTLSFTPQGDAKFTRDLLTPLSIDVIALALATYPDLRYGLHLLVSEINGARDVMGPRGHAAGRPLTGPLQLVPLPGLPILRRISARHAAELSC